jgi:hypothetical protein
MPRYFFDQYDGTQTSRDEVGTELAGTDEARRQAVVTLSEVAKEKFPADGDFEELGMNVRDSSGTTLLYVSLAFSVTWGGKL